MNLHSDDVGDYIEFLTPDAEDLDARKERAAARLREDPTYGARIHIARGDDGRIAAAVGAHPWMEGLWQVILRATSAEQLTKIHTPWLTAVRELEPRPTHLLCRLEVPSGLEVLAELGWHRDGERVEFRTPVADLPATAGSPLTWRGLEDVGFDLAARVFELAGKGPEWDEDDNTRELINGYLARPDALTVIEIGMLGEVPVAFIAATVEPATGWCTLTFMGVVESFRGQGLGRWVHLRGFDLLRQHGGTTYHGGTSAPNLPMRRLFQNHGCQPYRHLEEWSMRLDPNP